MRYVPRIAALLLGLTSSLRGAAFADARIKDITDVEGVRENQLIGYGLVVGLNGTGDKLTTILHPRIAGRELERLGVNVRDQVCALSTKNLAAVMVTAELPAFARSGSRVDVSVSALGDAKNLTGGTLLVTPLLAADGEVYAVAQVPSQPAPSPPVAPLVRSAAAFRRRRASPTARPSKRKSVSTLANNRRCGSACGTRT